MVASIPAGGGGAAVFRGTAVRYSVSDSGKLFPAPSLPLRLPSCPAPMLSSCACRAAKRKKEKQKNNSPSIQPVIEQDDAFREEKQEHERRGIKEEEGEEGIFDVEAFDDEILEVNSGDLEDGFEMEIVEPYVGDGGVGGGISLCGALWDNMALTIAEEVTRSFNGDLSIFSFKTSRNQLIQVRIEKLSTKYGSPNMADIEAFSSAYKERLDEAVNAGTIPENFSLEVSSPGLERAVRIPDDLERFKDKPMLVKYVVDADGGEEATSGESEGIFRLIYFDLESGYCTWGVADVRKNREKAGKGRPLSKKQKEWRLRTPFRSLRLVRLYSEC